MGIWTTLYGLGGYLLGENINRFADPVGTVTIILALLIIIVGFVLLRRNQQRLEERAEQALPGPLDL